MNQEKTGQFIAQLRREKGMTQQILGEKLGVTNKTVSRWENGNYMPDLSCMELLCKELDVGINELLCGQRIQTEEEFRQKADDNLIDTLRQDKKLRFIKNLCSFLTGGGTGILFSCLYSPDSIRRNLLIVISLLMILSGWCFQNKYSHFSLPQ